MTTNNTPRVGRRFGKLVVHELYAAGKSGNNKYTCRCDCGGTKVTTWQNLKRGDTKSCGCIRRLRVEADRIMPLYHSADGVKKHPLYETYRTMLRRCYEDGYHNYAEYGGRGVRVAQEWRNDFWQFVQDMGERPEHTTLDRIDNNGGYSPDNCRWATPSEQQLNKRTTRHIYVRGKRYSLFAAAKMFGVNPSSRTHTRAIRRFPPATALAYSIACRFLRGKPGVDWGKAPQEMVPTIVAQFELMDDNKP